MSNFTKKYRPRYVTTKSAFTISIIVIVLTVTIVWAQGLHLERSLVRNSLVSTIILSFFLFGYMFVGLYRGYKLKDDLGDIVNDFKLDTHSNPLDWLPTDIDHLELADGCENIIAWTFVTIVIGLLLFFFGSIIWFSIVSLLAILYWIFFRGLRLVFKKSKICRGDLVQSLKFAIIYTLLSTSWLVTIFFILEYQMYSIVALGSLSG